MPLSELQPGTLRVVAANLENRLGAGVESDPTRRAAVEAYLGRIASLRPGLIFFSEAAPKDVGIIPDVLAKFPGLNGFLLGYDDNDGRHDQHRGALLVDPAFLTGRVRAINLGGRRAFEVPLSIGGVATHAILTHLRDRTRDARIEQAQQLAGRLQNDTHALAAGDFNTIPAGAWQAKAIHRVSNAQILGRKPLRWAIDHLPTSEPGEPVPEIKRFGLAGKIATFFVQKVARFGSLTRRLVDMAEAPGDGPLEIMREQAGLQLVDTTYPTTKQLSRLTGSIGVPIDHSVEKGMHVRGFEVIDAGGAADHSGIVMDLQPTLSDD